MVPSYIRKDTIQPVSAVTPYNLRSSNKIRPPKAKTNIYKFHFIRTQWNKLPEQMYQNKSLGQFKNSLAYYSHQHDLNILTKLILRKLDVLKKLL